MYHQGVDWSKTLPGEAVVIHRLDRGSRSLHNWITPDMFAKHKQPLPPSAELVVLGMDAKAGTVTLKITY